MADLSDKVQQKFKKFLNPWQLSVFLGVINLTHLPRQAPDPHQDVNHVHLADLSDKAEQKFKKHPNPWLNPSF